MELQNLLKEIKNKFKEEEEEEEKKNIENKKKQEEEEEEVEEEEVKEEIEVEIDILLLLINNFFKKVKLLTPKYQKVVMTNERFIKFYEVFEETIDIACKLESKNNYEKFSALVFGRNFEERVWKKFPTKKVKRKSRES